MQVWFTFDYELFFGKPTGSVQKCMLEPTSRLMALSKKFKAPFTYFVDAGFLFKLNELALNFPELAIQHEQISEQLRELILQGNDVQLHVHPHWELSSYIDGAWDIPQDKGYRLDEFPKVEAAQIFKKYKAHLEAIIGRKTFAYRAGGWCIQPFEHIKEAFAETGMRYDSSVVAGMIYNGGVYQIDFSLAPKSLDSWPFDSDPVAVDEAGQFIEIPISGYYYKPSFYWEMYLRGRMNRARHRFIGDGNFIPQPGRKYQTLTRAQWNHVSCDGYYSKKLVQITRKFIEEKRQHLVVIGHPKGVTAFSFEQLERYFEKMKDLNFTTFSKYLMTNENQSKNIRS